MNKSELITGMTLAAGITRTQAGAALNSLTENITLTLVAGASVNIPGFCTIKAVRRAERPGRNPKTGESMTIAARVGVKFTAGKTLQDAINVS